MKKNLIIASILSLAFMSSSSTAQACGLFKWRFFNARPVVCNYYESKNAQCAAKACGVQEEYAPKPDKELAGVKLDDMTESETTLLEIVNDCRARFGLKSLRPDRRLFDGANVQTRRDASRGFLLHEGSPEILAQNLAGFEEAIKQWLASPAHRALLLNGAFTRCGASFYRDSYGRVWCAVRFQ
ncbi:MAG: CAP domain-containing protein [Thermoguttaceae bacterium]